jgi:AraC-like DNA-binding protein
MSAVPFESRASGAGGGRRVAAALAAGSAAYQPFPMLPGRRAQIWRYAPEFRRPRHFHPEPELNLVLAGTCTFGSGDACIGAAAGDIVCWPPGCDHELIAASVDLELHVLALSPELAARVLGERHSNAMAGPLRLEVPSALTELRALCSTPLAADHAAAEAHVAALWRRAHELRLASGGRRALGARVLRSLLAHPDLTRDERARVARGYPSEVSREFHRCFGVTVTQYRSRLRLLRFLELVQSGGGTLLSAALEAGFGSYSQCHRVFHSTLGCAPKAFFAGGLCRDLMDAFEPLDRVS